MLEKFLSLDDNQSIDSLTTLEWTHGAAVALSLIIAAIIFSVYLYRSEKKLLQLKLSSYQDEHYALQ